MGEEATSIDDEHFGRGAYCGKQGQNVKKPILGEELILGEEATSTGDENFGYVCFALGKEAMTTDEEHFRRGDISFGREGFGIHLCCPRRACCLGDEHLHEDEPLRFLGE